MKTAFTTSLTQTTISWLNERDGVNHQVQFRTHSKTSKFSYTAKTQGQEIEPPQQ